MSQLLSPIGCQPLSCCGDTFIIQQTGGGGGGGISNCPAPGNVRPEGAVIGDPGCWYYFSDGVEAEFWFKDSGSGTSTGWFLAIKLASRMSQVCRVVNIPGVAGPAGPAATSGTNGINAFGALLSGFVMPAIGDQVVAEISETAWIVPSNNIGLAGEVDGQVIVVQFAGSFLCTGIVDSTHVLLYNLGYATNAPAGSAIPTGSVVAPGGLKGADGTTLADALLQANNLSDVADIPTARTNLGLGSMAQQAAGSVAITGGAITGITDLAVTDGGTGASDAATARTNLGLGSMSVQAAGAVAISGGIVTGITDLAVVDGGTGASTAAGARANLGIGLLTVVTKIAGYVATLTDDVILVDATAGGITIDLPAAATATGKVLYIKKIDVSGNAVTIDGNVGDLIDGAATQALAAQWDALQIICNGTAWYVISNA